MSHPSVALAGTLASAGGAARFSGIDDPVASGAPAVAAAGGVAGRRSSRSTDSEILANLAASSLCARSARSHRSAMRVGGTVAVRFAASRLVRSAATCEPSCATLSVSDLLWAKLLSGALIAQIPLKPAVASVPIREPSTAAPATAAASRANRLVCGLPAGSLSFGAGAADRSFVAADGSSFVSIGAAPSAIDVPVKAAQPGLGRSVAGPLFGNPTGVDAAAVSAVAPSASALIVPCGKSTRLLISDPRIRCHQSVTTIQLPTGYSGAAIRPNGHFYV